jgi:excinuclease UvrABC nuclease subunit
MTSKELQYDDVDRIMTTLRDEAHRFSNQYRKKQMSMERTSPAKKIPKKTESTLSNNTSIPISETV